MVDGNQITEMLNWIVNHWAFCAFVIGIVFEVPKWRFKPFTALFKWIGKAINRPVMDEVNTVNGKIDDVKSELDTVKKSLSDLSKDVDMNEIDTIRSVVLDFANSCRNGRKHTHEEFNHIIELNDKYTLLLKKREIKNGVYETAYEYIKDVNDRCQRENSYLA